MMSLFYSYTFIWKTLAFFKSNLSLFIPLNRKIYSENIFGMTKISIIIFHIVALTNKTDIKVFHL